MKFKKIGKKAGKALDNLFEEWADLFAVLGKAFFGKKLRLKKLRKIELYGTVVMVRPAYVLAEKVVNLLKIIFGVSIIASGFVAAYWGVTRVSELISLLVTTTLGRIIIIVIGLSYLIVGLWKLANIHEA